jgi:hypothetical protein
VRDRDDVFAASFDCGSEILHVRPGGEPLVGLGGGRELAGKLLAGLAGTEQRTGENGVRLEALVPEALAEGTRLRPTLGRQRAQLVGLARSRGRMTNEVEAHARTISAQKKNRVT